MMFKDIAWNDIQLAVPAPWTLAQIDKQHLLFENQGYAVMEIKWNLVKGRFSSTSHLKKLYSQYKKQVGVAITPWQLPMSWQSALTNFDTLGFTWSSGSDEGKGAILSCPNCSKAIIFQLFSSNAELDPDTSFSILNSLRDHRTDGQVAWQIYDIQALVPDNFKLTKHQFKPGSYELVLTNRYEQLTLFRWAPAAAILNQGTLADFTADLLGVPLDNLTTTFHQGHPAVEWFSLPKHQWAMGLLRFKPKPAFNCMRLWQLVSKNRILGLRVESKKPIKKQSIMNICKNFTVSNEEIT